MNEIIFPDINLNGIKGVIIDIDNTLYAYQPAHEKAIKTCFDNFENDCQSSLCFEMFYEKYRTKRMEVIARLKPQGACRSRFFAFQALFEDTQTPMAFHKALTYEALYWKVFIDNIALSKHAEKFLEQCKKKKLPVCALSDMQAYFQVKKLQTLGIMNLIDYLVTSEETGAEKPHPIMFQTALKKLGLKAEKTVMIGDHHEKDIKGAQALGIKSFQVRAENE